MIDITLQLVVRTTTTSYWVIQKKLALPVEPVAGMQISLKEGCFQIERIRCVQTETGWEIQCLADTITQGNAKRLLGIFGGGWEEIFGDEVTDDG